MGAETPARRSQTARELAEQFGLSPRTIGVLVAEPRADFLARAKARRERAVELRATGLKHREITAEMDLPIGTVSYLLHQAEKLAAQETEEDSDGRLLHEAKDLAEVQDADEQRLSA